MGSAVVDPARVAHLSGVFAPVAEEVDAVDLVVDGELPRDLTGLYLRNGPNPRFTPIGSYLYPLDGDGMVHGVWLSDGRAHYRNRFVRTPGLAAEERAGRALWGGVTSLYRPGPDEVGPALADRVKDLPSGGVIQHAGRLLAVGDSVPPFRLSPGLDTLGPEDFGGALPAGIGAHPKTDPATGELIVFGRADRPPFLSWSILDRTGTVTRGPVPVPGLDRPVLVHDMAITGRYLVFVLAPCFVDPAAAGTGGGPLSWRADLPTRIALVPRAGGPVRWAADEAFWTWHTVNAHDEPDGCVALSYVQWSRPTLEDGDTAPNRCALTLARIDPAGGTVRREPLDDTPVEFPRIDERRLGRPHRFVAVAARTGRRELLAGEHDALRWYDSRGGHVQWNAGELSVGEAVFAPRPGAAGEEHGHWLALATSRQDRAGVLLVLPAEDPAAGPVARVRLPVPVPLGQHAAWLPTPA